MIADPVARGRALAAFHAHIEPALWADLLGSGVLPAPLPTLARAEWECFTLYACVRGLVAAGGFNRETVSAVDALHDAVVERWGAESPAREPLAERSARLAERYGEYGRIGQLLESRGAHLVTARLGEALARHVCAPAEPSAALAETAGGLHESLVEGAADAVRDEWSAA